MAASGAARLFKKKKKNEQRQRVYYVNNKQNVLSKRRDRYVKIKSCESNTVEAIRKRQYRQKANEANSKKQNEAERLQIYRRKLKSNRLRRNDENINMKSVFASRTKKHRAMKKFKENLPATPIKWAAVLTSYLKSHNSPTVNYLQGLNIISSEEQLNTIQMAESVMDDIKDAIDNTKRKRSDDSRATVNIMSAAITGESVKKSRCKTQLSRKLGITPKRLSAGNKLRQKILKSEISAWTYTYRKTRTDALAEDHKKKIYDFWISNGISRPTACKNDFKRVRMDKNVFIKHMKYILEVTQAEAYEDFKRRYPDIKISLRTFEKIKPFFVTHARTRDIETCCCRYHVEARYLFKRCMDYRRKYTNNCEHYPVYEHLTDLVNSTMCAKMQDAEFHEKDCIERKCKKCGVHLLKLSEGESSTDESSEDIEWMCYEYVTFKVKDMERKKLTLVKKQTKPGVMFQYLQKILQKYTAHVFRAKWQASQFRWLKQHLPSGHAICVHDFSENYTCKEKTEIQSSYFQRTEATLHVSLLYRHAILEVDGIESSEDEPQIVEEHFFVLSPDLQHDHHFTHKVQSLICEYLQSISCEINTMHEYTDGCASQYKSRHCVGDLSHAVQDFGYPIIRNYYETAHAKGPQDAAGGLIKRQADTAVQNGKYIIQTAEDLFNYATTELTIPKKTDGCKRRIFRYISEIGRNRNRQFKSIVNIRSLHQVCSTGKKCEMNIRNLSCYDCEFCIMGEMVFCNSYAGPVIKVALEHEAICKENVPDETSSTFSDLVQPGSVVAVYTDDNNHEYYLVKCTGPRKIITTEESDSWGNTFPSGALVFTGLYYDKLNGSHLNYKLLRGKPAIIPFAAVRFVCIGLDDVNHKLSLTEDLHAEIISSL